MDRAIGIILALLLLCVASPALAAIDKFTDDKGTLHITNSSKEKARLEEREEDTSARPQRVPKRPAVVQPPPEPEQPEPAEADKEEPKPSSYLTVHKGVIHITNVKSKSVDLAQPHSAPTPGPVAEASAAPVMPAAFAQAAAAPAAPSPQPLPAGDAVKSYRDKKGVLHITNAPAKPFQGDIMVAGWSSGDQAGPPGQAPVASRATGTVLARKLEPQEVLPLRPASLLESGPLAVLPVMPASLSCVPVGSAKVAKTKVRRFRDDKGIINIVGIGPAPTDRRQVSQDQAVAPAGRTPVLSGLQIPTLPPPARWAAPTVALRRDKQGRLVIQNAPRGSAPQGDKEEMCRRLAPVVVEAAFLYGLPVSLIEAVIKVESNFQPAAVSPKGAMGLMQLMPGTAKFLGVADAFSPRENVLGGTRYLRLLLDFFGQSLPLALAAYNAGFQRVIDAGCQVPDIRETQDFVTKVMGHYHLREKQRLAQRLTL